MKTQKMSLANMQGKLSRHEMKSIMAGAVALADVCNCNSKDDCTAYNEMCLNTLCDRSSGKAGTCGCSAPVDH